MLGYLRERERVNSKRVSLERERERENENFDGKNDDDALYNSRRKGVWPTAFFFFIIILIFFFLRINLYIKSARKFRSTWTSIQILCCQIL